MFIKNMKTVIPLFLFTAFIAVSCASCDFGKSISGKNAFFHVKKIVDIGSRIPGSEGSIKTQKYILDTLKKLKVKTKKQSFQADTPIGKLEMTNIIAFFEPRETGENTKTIVIGTHYDTKYIKGINNFAGANDGTSGVGIFLELAEILKKQNFSNTVEMIFFDGEESFEEKESTDWFYGSRFYVDKLKVKGLTHKVAAMILIDMVGDKDFTANLDLNSDPSLIKKTSEIAKNLGYEKYFFGKPLRVRDDHIPFLEAGIPSIDIIDFAYGGTVSPGYYWHTAMDTLDKVSPETLSMVGKVVFNLIKELDREI